MITGMREFVRGIMRLPHRVQVWLAILGGVNLVGPLCFFGRQEARVVLGMFLLAFALMSMLTRMLGFTRILGLGHIVWFALLPYLRTRLDDIPQGDPWASGSVASCSRTPCHWNSTV